MARGRGRKKQAQKPSKTALEELLGEEANGEEDEEATQATQQPWLAQSQKLYRHHAAFSESQAASQSQSQKGRGAASSTGKTQKKTPEKKASKQDKKGDDSSATEASDEETDNESKPGQTDGVDGTGTGHAKPSLLSYGDPIPDFEKLIKQGGMMTSTSMRQSERTLPRRVEEREVRTDAFSLVCEMIPVFIKDAKTEAELKKSRDCLVHARRAAIEEDESVLYNGYVPHKLIVPREQSLPVSLQASSHY